MSKEVLAEVVEVESGRSAMSRYMSEVHNIPTLTDEECVELGKMLTNAEQREYAKQRLVEGNLRLVVKIAYDWKGKGLGIEDLVAEGNQALMTAAEKFDIETGKSFSTYAMWWIRSAMSRAVNSSHTVRIPDASAMKKRSVIRFVDEFKSKFGKEPTRDEIQKGLGLSNIEIRNIFKLDNSCVSINAKFDDSDESSDEIGDVIAKENVGESVLDEIVKKEEIDNLHKAINMLDEREKIVIIMRYGIGCDAASLEEVAVKIGKTKERVRQIQRTAESKLGKLMLAF